MSTFVLGDIQGCYREFKKLVKKIKFRPGVDRLIAAGDLINRGPNNVSTIKLLQDIGAECVLGNHDLNFLAVAAGIKRQGKSDTLNDLLESKHLDEIKNWFCQLPLLINLEEFNSVVVHAGIPHVWSIDQARVYAAEIESVIQSSEREDFFTAMYGNEPNVLNDGISGQERMRVITNYLTRMRFCSKTGELELTAKADIAPEGYAPWFSYKRQDNTRILFGHWAALEGQTKSKQFIALDTGCVWGRELTALRLEDNKTYSVSAQSK